MVISSSDGYCTIVRFDNGELGVPLADSELPVGARRVASTNIDVSPPSVYTAVAMPSNNQTTPSREVAQVASPAESSSDGLNRKPGPRRVQLITLSTTPQGIAAATTATATTQHNTSDTSTITNTPTSCANDVIIL